MLYFVVSLIILLTASCSSVSVAKKSEYIKENLPKREKAIQKKHEYFLMPKFKDIN